MPLFGSRSAESRIAAFEPLLAEPVRAMYANDATTLDDQLNIARVAAPTGHEHARAVFVKQLLNTCGWRDTAIDAIGNVVARRPCASEYAGGAIQSRHASSRREASRHDDDHSAPVVCLAHLDTAFSENTPLDPVIEGNRILCPGIGDNGRGVAGMIALARALGMPGVHANATPLRRPIELVFTVGEEGLGNLRGAHHYFDQREQAGLSTAHAAIVLDGPGDSRVVHHALGSRRYRISFRGHGGHSWADYGAPNAVHAAGRATAWLADIPRALSGRLSLTVSRIGGGESVNAIPEHAWLDIDLRATDERLLGRADVEIRKVAAAASRAETDSRGKGASLVTDIVLLGERPCGELPREHPLVALAVAATEWQRVDAAAAVASTDANVPLARGIPAIAIGAGGVGGDCHTTHEWYENTDAPRGLVRALAIVAGMAGAA